MLKFVGDINLTDWDFNFGFGIGSRIAEGFNPFSQLYRNSDDIWIGNFEGVASDVTINKGMASKVFRISPASLNQLKHFDVYNLANNHTMQHGVDAYQQMWEALQSFGSKTFGKEDCRTIVIEHQGRKVSLTGCCYRIDEFNDTPLYWYKPEYETITRELELISKDTFKVFFVHWGNEYINRPSIEQKRFAHWLINTGFDLIIGMHPHVLQGYEEYKGKRIYYSLGNFVFDMQWEPCRYGAIIGVDLTESVPKFSNEYIYIDNTCTPNIVSECQVPYKYRFDYLNKELQKESNSEVYHNEIFKLYKLYRNANRKQVIKNILRHPKFGVNVVSDFIKRRF